VLIAIQGSEAYMETLETPFSAEFRRAVPRNWTVPGLARVAGYVRSAGGDGQTAGLQTFVNVYEAGHYVPWDQPEASLVRAQSSVPLQV
jgi:cathepsin A (carboxypeptidase C)